MANSVVSVLVAVSVLTFGMFECNKLTADPLQTPGPTALTNMSSGAVVVPSTPNTAPSPSPDQSAAEGKPPEIFDDTDAGWTWKNTEIYNDVALYGKSGHAGEPGSYGQYTFHGTGVKIYGMAGPAVPLDGTNHPMGSALVWVDGKQLSETPASMASVKYRFVLAKVDGLPEGEHILLVEPKDGWLVVDYLEVMHTPLSVKSVAKTASAASSQFYRLVPMSAPDKYLTVVPGPQLFGSRLQIWQPDPTRMQTWRIVPALNGQYTLCPAADTTLSVCIFPHFDPKSAPGDELWTNSGRPDQVLTFTQTSEGYYNISCAAYPNVVMCVNSQSSDNGTLVGGSRPPAGKASSGAYSR